MATAIEKDIHANSTHESAVLARSAIAAVRKYAHLPEKAGMYVAEAVAHHKDYALWDDAIKGERMNGGRKPGALEPVAKKIRAYLQKHPNARALEVWNAIKGKPPKGYEFFDETARVSRYVLKPDGRNMEWRTFENHVSKQRQKPPKITD